MPDDNQEYIVKIKEVCQIIILILFVFIGIGFSYIQYKKSNVENSVIEYLTTEKSISEEDIISSKPFISNLPGFIIKVIKKLF